MSSDANLDEMIAQALGKSGGKYALEPLIEVLKLLNVSDEYLLERREIVYAISEFNDPRAVDVLLEALNHRLYYVGDDGNRYEEHDEKTVEAIEWGLTDIGDPRALEPVFERILVDWYQDAEILIEWGEPAFQLLMTELKTNAHNRDSNAASLLGDFRDARAVEPIIELLLNHEDNSARSSAAYALGKINDLRALDPLIATLKNPDPWTRSQAAEALGLLGDKRAVEALTSVLEDEDNLVRSAARTAIKRIENPDISITGHWGDDEKIFGDLSDLNINARRKDENEKE